LRGYQYSSYSVYLGKKKVNWVKPELVLEYFGDNKDSETIKHNSYQQFVEDDLFESEEILSGLIIEED